MISACEWISRLASFVKPLRVSTAFSNTLAIVSQFAVTSGREQRQCKSKAQRVPPDVSLLPERLKATTEHRKAFAERCAATAVARLPLLHLRSRCAHL